jgi:pyruvate formate lyase activating enzyme
MLGSIFDIQRFCIHDGPGIRTTVFVKGCPLRCQWCHNPESQKREPSLAYYDGKCIACGACVNICELKCHTLEVDDLPQILHNHGIDREKCIKCGICAKACPTDALELLGRQTSVDDVMSEVLRDKAFYGNSGGGITVSGGEPLMQSEFLLALLKSAKEQGIHTCIETCGFAAAETVKSIVPYTDLFLYDIKETDSERHKELTGVPLDVIISNLKLIDGLGAKTVLRCPLIPEKNLRNEHLEGIARLVLELKNVTEINIMAYHTLGSSKYEALSLVDEMKGIPAMTDEQKKKCIEKISVYITELGKSIPVK